MIQNIDKAFQNKHGKLAIVQWPNIPLWTWIVASLLTLVVHATRWNLALKKIGVGALIVWAGLEIYYGESLFRRILGGIVLLAIAKSHI